MDAKERLVEYKKKLDPQLERFFEQKVKEYEKVSPFSSNFVKALSEYTLRGGKRLRAALISYTYKMFGGQKDEEVIKLSMFVELLQSFLLIHDDIFDRSNLRRGADTMHKIYEKYAKEQGYEGPAFFGEVMAVLNGDIANQMAFEIIAGSKFEAIKLIQVVNLVAQKTSDVLLGQVEDYLLPYKTEYSEQDLINVLTYKTATYTYELPVLTGAILGGATESDMALLKEFSRNAGIAFQIQDDYLGLFGSEEKLGKSTLSDLQEGKKTLFMLDVMKNGTDKQCDIVQKYLGKKNITHAEAEEVKRVVHESGALRRVQERSVRFTNVAFGYLDQLDYSHTGGWTFLKDIADYMIKRNK